MYQVLYRKWRPRTFDDVIGQSHVTLALKNEVISNRLSHAYLFTGSRGTGKTSCAKILSKAVNCLSSEDGNPCGECDVCKGIDNGSVMDVVEIDAASNNGVDDVRGVIEESAFLPARSRYRVYIIDEVHMLTTGAFNALLKTLEEPPSHVIFILATTEVHKLPSTILSRCQRFDFRRIPITDVAERIKYICQNENIEIDNDSALMIGRLSDGALRDALSILDKCISLENVINIDCVEQAVGMVGSTNIINLADFIFDKKVENAISLIGELYGKSKDMIRLCEELTGYFRNLMISKATNDLKELDILYSGQIEMVKRHLSGMSLNDILYYTEQLQETIRGMSKGVDKRIEMEIAIVKLCSDYGNFRHLEARIKKLESIIYNLNLNENTSLVKTSTHSISNTPKKSALEQGKTNDIIPTVNVAESTENNEAVPLAEWSEILRLMADRVKSKSVSVAFKGSSAYRSGDFILIDSQNSLAFELLRESAHRNEMRRLIKEVTGKQYRLGPYKRASNETKKVDPLDSFSDKVRKSGVNINIK